MSQRQLFGTPTTGASTLATVLNAALSYASGKVLAGLHAAAGTSKLLEMYREELALARVTVSREVFFSPGNSGELFLRGGGGGGGGAAAGPTQPPVSSIVVSVVKVALLLV